jgi:hypothetical protein
MRGGDEQRNPLKRGAAKSANTEARTFSTVSAHLAP